MKNGVIDYVRAWRADNKWARDNRDAQKEFDSQAQAVKDISWTPGYAAIVQFFSQKEKAAVDRSLAHEDASSFLARCEARVCRDFLAFLKSRELAESPEKDTKEA